MRLRMGVMGLALAAAACTSASASDLEDRVKKLEDQVRQLTGEVAKLKTAGRGRGDDEQPDREVTVSVGEYIQGNKDAKVGIVEFSDFQ